MVLDADWPRVADLEQRPDGFLERDGSLPVRCVPVVELELGRVDVLEVHVEEPVLELVYRDDGVDPVRDPPAGVQRRADVAVRTVADLAQEVRGRSLVGGALDAQADALTRAGRD